MKYVISVILLLLCYPLYSGYPDKTAKLQPADSADFIEKVYIHIDRNVYYTGDDVWFKAYLIDGTYNTLTQHSELLHVELISGDNKIIDSRNIKLSHGLGNGDFHVFDKMNSGIYHIRAYTNYMRNFSDDLFYNKEIIIINVSDGGNPFHGNLPDTLEKPEVYFFPEGGSLLYNTTSLVALKITDRNGSGLNTSGSIFTSSGEKVTDIVTSHKGMGIFKFTPVAGIDYFATLLTRNGFYAKYKLPVIFSKGINMSLARNEAGELDVIFRTNPESLPEVRYHEYSLSLSQYNQLISTYSFMINTLNSSIKIPSKGLSEGIYMLTLTEDSIKPVAERLFFIHNTKDNELKVETDKKIYNKRDSVSLMISFTDTLSKNDKAFFSASATNYNFTPNNSSFPSTISSWFLLESNIRGTVEEPSYYFDSSNPDRLRNLDLLLLTQGWRDFACKYDSLYYQPEHGFAISGKARKLLTDVPLKNSTVTLTLLHNGKPLVDVVPVEDDGRFLAEGIDFTGTARLFASITDEKDDPKGWLLLDSTIYSPAPVNTGACSKNMSDYSFFSGKDGIISDKDSIITNTYHKFIQYAEITAAAKRKYILSDTIALGEVRIIAKRVDWTESARSRSIHYLTTLPDKEIVISPQDESFYTNAHELLTRKMVINPGLLRSPRRLKAPLYMVNGNRVSEMEVKTIPIRLIERIDVVNDPGKTAGLRTLVTVETADSTGRIAMSDMTYSDGAISIILKDLDDPYFYKPAFHSTSTRFVGFSEPHIFYSPKHNKDQHSDYNPDIRATLFWEPNIVLENNKHIQLKYFNGDTPSPVNVIIEGITSYGIPVSAHTEYLVK
jgi:hypothetical protein